MRYFLDTEFNGWRGDLLSLALICEDGRYIYTVMEPNLEKGTNTWVARNVVPHIYKGPFTVANRDLDIAKQIAKLLKNDPDPVIVVDWPDDIKHFCNVMVFGPGQHYNLDKYKFEFNRKYGHYESKVPHNAYYDALAIKETWTRS